MRSTVVEGIHGTCRSCRKDNRYLPHRYGGNCHDCGRIGSYTCGFCGEDGLTWIQPYNTDKMYLSPGKATSKYAQPAIWITDDEERWFMHLCSETKCRDCDNPILWIKTDEGFRPSGEFTRWAHANKNWIDQATGAQWPRHACPSWERAHATT